MAPDSLDTRPWYVCYTKPRQEALAFARLQEQHYELYLPELVSWARQGGQWQRRSQPMFPRYLFVRPAHAQQAIGPIRSTPGVTKLVTFGPVIACLSAARLRGIQSLVDAAAARLPDDPLQPGAAVVFSEGPLKGMSGLVSDVAAERVGVLITLLGSQRSVQVSPQLLALA